MSNPRIAPGTPLRLVVFTRNYAYCGWNPDHTAEPGRLPGSGSFLFLGIHAVRAAAMCALAQPDTTQVSIRTNGIDMTRDIQDRIRMFAAHHVGTARADNITITRVALNMSQVREYNPPENPAKTTDSRFQDYAEKFGESSWELDALNPRVLTALVEENIATVRNAGLWEETVINENTDRALLGTASEHWNSVTGHLYANHKDTYDKLESQA